jgi:DNA modification methylase
LTTTMATNGVIGMTDFRGDVIRSYLDNGWIFHGEVTVDKDPQAQAIRTKAQALMFVTKNRDSSMTRPALADYLLLFRKPGENVVQIKNDVSNEEWIEWARPVWLDIRETNTLNARVARDSADERHICPLQLDFIERVVRLWSNTGETVFTPFGGIGSEVYTAVRLGRRGLGIELKPSYWRTAVANLQSLETEMNIPSLFDQAI